MSSENICASYSIGQKLVHNEKLYFFDIIIIVLLDVHDLREYVSVI